MKSSRQSLLSLLEGPGHLVEPERFLAFEDPGRYFDESARTVQRKPLAPRLRDATEIFLEESSGSGERLFPRHRVQADPDDDMSKKVGGIAHGIAPGNRTKVDENDAVARQKNMFGLQIPMDRRRR